MSMLNISDIPGYRHDLVWLVGCGVSDLLQELSQSGVFLPQEEDYQGAAAAIVRVQKTYRVDTASMSRGVVRQLGGDPITEPRDMFTIGVRAEEAKHYGLAISWLQLAETGETDEDVRRQIMQHKEQCYIQVRHHIGPAVGPLRMYCEKTVEENMSNTYVNPHM